MLNLKVMPSSITINQLLYTMLESATDLSIPKQDCGRGVECCLDVPVIRLTGRSYQDWMVRQPVRLGGMGMRSMRDVSLAAFLGSVEQALPHFVGAGGVCQQLGRTLGDMTSSVRDGSWQCQGQRVSQMQSLQKLWPGCSVCHLLAVNHEWGSLLANMACKLTALVITSCL